MKDPLHLLHLVHQWKKRRTRSAGTGIQVGSWGTLSWCRCHVCVTSQEAVVMMGALVCCTKSAGLGFLTPPPLRPDWNTQHHQIRSESRTVGWKKTPLIRKRLVKLGVLISDQWIHDQRRSSTNRGRAAPYRWPQGQLAVMIGYHINERGGVYLPLHLLIIADHMSATATWPTALEPGKSLRRVVPRKTRRKSSALIPTQTRHYRQEGRKRDK